MREVLNYGLKGPPETNLEREFGNIDTNKEDKKHAVMPEVPKASQVPEGQFILAMSGTTLRLYTNYRGTLKYIDFT